MPRKKSPYRLKKRGKFWYYKFPEQSVFHSTDKTTKVDAEKYILELLKKGETPNYQILKNYSKPFYIYEDCPHIRRLIDENKSIGKLHCKNRRSLIDNYILCDSIANKKLSEIKRADILDFRERLKNKDISVNLINKIIGTLKTIFSEALYREEINRNPVIGIGNIKEKPKERGIFTEDELKVLFPVKGLGVWENLQDFTCFLLAATTGMRRGEILALQWRDISFEEEYLTVRRAWKNNEREIGPPKWNKIRYVPLSSLILERLKKLHDNSLNCLPDNFVFCYCDGTHLGGAWWKNHFIRAMERASINFEERNLTPHSFRHTLNSILKSKGYSAEMIRASLGWSDEKIQDNYTHWKPESLSGQAEIIDNIWSKK